MLFRTFCLDLEPFWGRSGVAFRSIWWSTSCSDEKRPTLTKHCSCAAKRGSGLPRATSNSIGNRCRGLLRNALRKGRSKKWPRDLPKASWDRFGSLRDAPRASWEIPGGLPGVPQIVPGCPEALRGFPRANLDAFCVNLGSILSQFPLDSCFDSSFVPSFVRSFVHSFVRSFDRSFARSSVRRSSNT